MRSFEFLTEEKINNTSVITNDIKALGKLFKKNGHELRLVGGVVRDVLIGKEPKDIDFATDATPEEMTKFLQKAKIKVVPTGIEHGTITAVYKDKSYEITTLRADKETDGRHAEVEFVRNWKEDAKRRDLTYNAMSMDMEGEVHDYFNGMDDLQNKVSKFVGDPDERIKEDYLRILRYFRFQSRLEDPTFDKDTLTAIKNNASGLKRISVERIWQEMSKLLTGQGVKQVLHKMSETGVAANIGLNTKNIDSVKYSDAILNLAALVDNDEIASKWRLSNQQSQALKFYVENKKNTLNANKAEDFIIDGVDKKLVANLALLQGKESLLKDIMEFEPQDFPVSGQDLLSLGMKAGPEVGNTLNTLKAEWKKSRFKLTKQELLQKVKK